MAVFILNKTFRTTFRSSRWRRPQHAPRIGNSPLIFSSPELQNLGVRAMWHFSTAAMWSLVIYMLTPLSTISAWIISAILGYTQLLANDVYLETMSQLKLYFYIICIVGAWIALKLTINVLTENIHFRNKKQPIDAERLQKVAEESQPLNINAVSKFQLESNFKRMVAHHDDHGHLIGVDMLPV